MLIRYLFVFTFIHIFKVSYGLTVDDNLDNFLESTTNFFEQLKLNYESQPTSPELYKSIDNEVSDYVEKVKKSANLSRGKRQLDLNKDIGILNGFETVSGLDLPDAIDIQFFVHRAEEPHWYAAVLNSSGICLFHYQNQTFHHVGFYGLTNGARIISHSCESVTLIVVQRTIGDTVIIRFSHEDDEKTLAKVQTVDTPEATHASLWRGMKQIYLGVASPKNITIFTWLGEHFDRIQTTNFGATRLVPFETWGSMHLVVIEQSSTLILKFLLRSNQFVVVQRLVGANDATTFHLKKGHYGEHFLALAEKRSTLVYKQFRHRFVPLQEISGADEITSKTNDAAMLLFLVKNGQMKIHQYDGWKFIESGIRDYGISSVRSVDWQGGEFLAVRLKDSRNVSLIKRDDNKMIQSDDKIVVNSAGKMIDKKNENIANFTEISSRRNESNLRNEEFSITMNSWSLRRILWRRKETWSSLRERTKIWCQDSLQKTLRSPPTVPELKGPIVINRGYIQNLRVQEVNGQSAEKFVKLAERWNAIVSEMEEQKKALKRYISTENPRFKNLRAANVRVNCTTSCRAENTEISGKGHILERLRRIDDVNQNLNFRKVRASFVKNLPCPIPAPKFHDATVSGLVNGISFPEFVEDVMKLTGDQVLTASHTFSELRVTNAKIPVDMATNFTRQDIVAKNVEVEELDVTSGDFLLPLNSDRPTVMSGSLTVSKARVKGLVDMHGKIRGPGAKVLSPTIHIIEPLVISRNISLQNVKVVETLEARDLTRSGGKSCNQIISEAVPLNSEHIPVRFRFRHDKVSWTNMTLRNFPYKWVTNKNTGNAVITGHKYATRPNITLGHDAYKNLPIPSLPGRLCSVAAISEDIWESHLVIDRGSAKSVKTINVFDNSELAEIYLDSAKSLDEVPWSLKNLTGRIIVKEAKVVNITGLDYKGLQNSMARWIEPGRLKGPLSVKKLHVNHLIPTEGFKTFLPLEVGSVESKANLYVGTINHVDYVHFMDSTVKIGDTISLTNVTFAGGLVATEIFASKTSFSLQENLSTGYLGSKEIYGRFEAEGLIVPDLLHLPSFNDSVNIVANGNVIFMKEPKITIINNSNLERLYNEVWLTDRPNTIFSDHIEFKNVTFESGLKILKSFDTPNLGPWAGLENRLLSKTKAQVINVDATFNSIIVPNVIGSPNSNLRTNVSYLYDLEFNSLKKNSTQVINDKWHFEELIVKGNFELHGRLNGLNLTTDVVRNDVEKNMITGKKTVSDLTARNIDGLKFDKFARNALRKNNGNRTIIVKGWKTFKTVEMQDVRVDGTIMGRRIENSLLKSGNQNLRGNKVFQGSLTTPAIITDGFVNDIKLPYFVKYQLKKRAPLQIIKTPIMFVNNLTILGNMTINGLYQGVDLKDFKKTDDRIQSVIDRTSELLNFAGGIEIALKNRAVYWDSLELLEENSTPLISDPVKNEMLDFDDLGLCGIKKSSLHCNDRKVFDPLPIHSNGSRILQAEVVELSGISLVASVTSDPAGGVFIFRYDRDEKRFSKIADLRVPGIMEGSITTSMDSLWISLRLRDHTMIIRYEIWSDFKEWVLPGNGPFLMSSTPTDELLIFRSDGVWKLGGLAGPRKIFHATLNGQIDTFSFGPDYYVQLTENNVTTLLKTKYIGN